MSYAFRAGRHSVGLDTVMDFSAAQNDMINVSAYTGGNVVTVQNAAQADALAHMIW